jgi:hypothetical protein
MSETLGEDPRIAALLGEVREGLALSEASVGDAQAQAEVRAFRDGVPPPAVAALTVGRERTLEEIRRRIDANARGQRPGLMLLDVRAGDGLSHLLRWAKEQGESARTAVATLDAATIRSSSLVVQEKLLGSAHLRGRHLADVLYSERAALAEQTVVSIKALTGELSGAGLRTISVLLEATAAGRTADAFAILERMQGGDLERQELRRLGLPSERCIADTTRGVVIALTHVVRAFGASGLLLLLDARVPPLEAIALSSLPFAFMIAGGSSRDPRFRASEVGPLGEQDQILLARRIRDRHLHAYNWSNASSVTNRKLETCIPVQPGITARDWVRTITAVLDQRLARDECQ